MGNCVSNNKSSKKDIIVKQTNGIEPISYVDKKNNKHLICDDAYTNRLVLKKYLVRFGCEVDEAENGEDAINKVKLNGEYSTIWMDIKMPKMDGLDCTKYLRNIMEYNGAIIGLTGYVDDITINKCLLVGMNRVIAKPFDIKIIEMHIEDIKKLNNKN